VFIKLFINHETSPAEVTKYFSMYYPYLKPVFYRVIRDGFESVDAAGRQDREPLAEFAEEYILNISSNRTIEELQKDCLAIGIELDVLRKNKEGWTSDFDTGNRTLQRHNYEAWQRTQEEGDRNKVLA
jgi:hypothetical protein